MLFKTLILTNCDLVASAIARAEIPSFLKTFIPTLISRSIDKFSTTADYDQRVIRIIKKIRELEGTYASDKNIK